MKKIYMLMLAAMPFGGMTASAQSDALADSVKRYTTEFLDSVFKVDANLQLDTVCVKDSYSIKNRGSFGVCSPEGTIGIKYLVTNDTSRAMQNAVDVANGILPVAYGHEKDHRLKFNLYTIDNLKSPSWTPYDYAVANFVQEITAHMAEAFAMRQMVKDGKITRSVLVDWVEHMPAAKLYLQDYFLYLTANPVTDNLSQIEANLIVDAITHWITDYKAGKDMYLDFSCTFSSWANSNNIVYLNTWGNKAQTLMTWDEFMHRAFTFDIDGRPVDILGMADKKSVDKMLMAISESFAPYNDKLGSSEIIMQGRSKSIAKLVKQYKKNVRVDRKSVLRPQRVL